MKNIWNSKVLFRVMGLVLVVLLTLTTVLPVLAADTASLKPAIKAESPNLVKGKVSSIATDQKSFELLNAAGDIVVISVDKNTQYFLVNSLSTVITRIKEKVQAQPKEKKENIQEIRNDKPAVAGQKVKNVKNANSISTSQIADAGLDIDYEEDPLMEEELKAVTPSAKGTWAKLNSLINRNPNAGHKAAFSDLAVGDGVVVKVMPDGNLAKQVLMIKVPNIKIIKGEVTEVTSDSFTITPKNAAVDPVSLKWDANSRIVIKGAISLKTGQYAVAVYKVSDLTVRMMDVFPVAPSVTAPATTAANAS